MSQANPKTDEPSMEEILASIRRIIADDQEAARKGDEEDPFEQAMADAIGDDGAEMPDDFGSAALAEEEEDDVLDLAEVGEAVPPADLELDHDDIDFRSDDGQVDFDAIDTGEAEPEELQGQDAVDAAFDAIGIEDETDEDDGLEFGHAEEPAPAPAFEPEPAYTAPAQHAFVDEDRLISRATDEAVGNAFNQLAHTVLANNGRTLDDLVKEMLRPMLKVWLDDNLPSIVERMVRAEIERVSRGGR